MLKRKKLFGKDSDGIWRGNDNHYDIVSLLVFIFVIILNIMSITICMKLLHSEVGGIDYNIRGTALLILLGGIFCIPIFCAHEDNEESWFTYWIVDSLLFDIMNNSKK